jgi:anti-sigma-K factor RskA
VTESLHALSGAYVVDALDDEERATFERHLPGCVDCQHEVASLREATALMADDAATTPPPALRDSVLAGIKTIRPLPPEMSAQGTADSEEPAPTIAKVLPMRPRRRQVAILVAAAAAVVAIVGGAVYQPWQDDNPPSQTITAADRVMNAVDVQKVSTSFEDGSSATVYRSRSQRRAVLLTQDMDPPPAGKAYEAWLQDETGAMRPAGLMKGPGGNHKLLLKGDAANVTGVGITVEPEIGSTKPTTPPIALLKLVKADA